MTTISIINGIIIQDGRAVVSGECRLGLRVENVLEFFSKNRINMELSGNNGYVSLRVGSYVGKQKMIKALIDDKVIKPSQLLQSA